MSILSVLLISLAISCLNDILKWEHGGCDHKNLHFILLQFQFLYIHIIMFFILGVKKNWENEHTYFWNGDHFWNVTGAFHKFWTMESPVCVNLYLNSRCVLRPWLHLVRLYVYSPILMCSGTLLARIFSPVMGDTMYCSSPVSGCTGRALIKKQQSH